jgi:hypothetical protein
MDPDRGGHRTTGRGALAIVAFATYYRPGWVREALSSGTPSSPTA